ncbi:hypothetical protein ACFSR7_06075 [Cohnella sp. GCM10020058]|uniref:hypothetical protein n=1 Tax=Cohnella sp. GCM10020058 TaxID=3317330 RepID=UPI0036352763
MPHEFDARSTLRRFIRTIEKRGSIVTANGKVNLFAGKTNLSLHLKTSESRRPITLSYKMIRSALQLTFYARSVTRRDLEVYSKGSNSALLGVLIEIFGSKGKLQRLSSGAIRLSLRGIRYFFAGGDRSVRDITVAAQNGAKYVLMSYAHIRARKAWRTHVERLGLKVLLDSGAYTVWQAARRGKQVDPIELEQYAEFILRNQQILYGYFNLDVIGDAEGSRRNAEYLRRQGLHPIEVWHIGNSVRELDRMVKAEQPIVAVGGSVGLSEKKRARIFRWVFRLFPDQNFHFLGGSSKLLQAFPWFSADSTGWTVGRKYGAIIDAFGQRKGPEGADPLELLAYNVRYLSSLETAA